MISEGIVFPQSSSLVIPTLEATARAARLISCAVGMFMDYKLANYFDYYDEVSSLLFSRDSKDTKMEEEHVYWERQVELRREDLEQAQVHYSRASHHHIKSYTARVEAKRHEKEAMLQAAQRLAEAEEQLASLAGSGSRTSRKHQHAATRLLHLCRRNGGVYIKIGQHLANLDYLLPNEYITTLSSLFDDTPQTSYDDVAAVIQEELGVAPNELFDHFDPQPMASASLAQVHVAYEKKTGRKLAIKVQHRGLRETSRGDLLALVTVVRWAERYISDFTYGWLADEIVPHLPKELDFANEGRNAERAADYLEQCRQRRGAEDLDCVVPKVLWKHTSARVLTMEFEEGVKATDVGALEELGLDRSDVANLVSSVFASQIFAGPKGHVHCDPHPGNLLVRPSRGNNKQERGTHGGRPRPQLVLLDHGLYRELDDDFRFKYAALWKSLMLADLRGIRDVCHQLGVGDVYPLFAAVITARPFDELIERSKHGSLHRAPPSTQLQAASPTNPKTSTEVASTSKSTTTTALVSADHAVMRGYAQRYMTQIFEMLGTLPRQMLLLLKLNDCLRHIDFRLGSPTNTLIVCGRYAARAVLDDTLRNPSSTWLQKFHGWCNYVHILFRIQLHNVGVWWLEQQQQQQQSATLTNY